MHGGKMRNAYKILISFKERDCLEDLGVFETWMLKKWGGIVYTKFVWLM
jgi:hypothetical protein